MPTNPFQYFINHTVMTDSNIKYLNLKKVIEKNLFRVPDYQRGFSWEEPHFEALWKDLCHLQKGKIDYHYTGILTVEKIRPTCYEKWGENEAFYFSEFDGYFIVDGQQRLISITILLHEIIKAYFNQRNEAEQPPRLLRKSKAVWIEDYFIRHKDQEFNQPTFILGYDTDNPSDLYFKAIILEYTEYLPAGQELEETAYTRQLSAAKEYFAKEVGKFLIDYDTNQPSPKRYEKLADLCRLLTERMMFDFKVLDNALDIFMVFETMNTRGKPLSNLEMLKNRLIYLATLLQNIDPSKDQPSAHATLTQYTSDDLRQAIVQCWKEIYQELGRDGALLNTDNQLLRYHWEMYNSYDRKNTHAYIEGLFKKEFTVSRAVHKKIGQKDIRDYINSLKEIAKWWYVLIDPNTPKSREYVNNTAITEALIRLKRLKYRYFPLLFAALCSKEPDEQKLAFLKAMEHYVFLLFSVSSRRANTGSSHFLSLASEVYNQRNGWNLGWIESSFYEWIHGGEGYSGYFSWGHFKQHIESYIMDERTEGYRNWNGLKYFLTEYSSPKTFLPLYDQYQIMPIYQWEEPRDGVNIQLEDKRYCRYLESSLGNYVLVNRTSGRNFDSLKTIQAHLEAEELDPDFLQYEEWTPQIIAERGKKMLTFLEERWGTRESQQLSEVEKMDLLFLNFMITA